MTGIFRRVLTLRRALALALAVLLLPPAEGWGQTQGAVAPAAFPAAAMTVQAQAAPPPPPASAKTLARDRRNVVAARRHFLKNRRRSFNRVANAISEGSVFRPLLAYWRGVFELRRNRTGDLIVFAAEPGAPPCAKLLAEFDSSRAAVLRHWQLDEKMGDPLCRTLYKHAHKRELITDEMMWLKIRDLAGERQLTATLRLMRAIPGRHRYSAVRKVSNRATRHLRSRHALNTRRNRELLMIAAAASARRHPSFAIRRWGQFSRFFSDGENAFVYARLAEWAARWQREDALELYRRADDFAARAVPRPRIYDENARAWRVRAALRAGDFAEVLKVTNAMPEEEIVVSAWRYWQAAAMQRRGGEDARNGENLMRQLAKDEDDFYGLLARQTLGLPLTKVEVFDVNADTNAVVSDVKVGGDFAMALELQKAGLESFARKIWRANVRGGGASKSETVAAAEAAARQGWYLASVNAADYVRGPRQLRFPTPYADEVMKYSSRFGLDPAFVYGIIRQESRFMPKIRSSAGARGLMQIIPRTAKLIARKHGYGRYRLSRLTRVDTNVILGTTYLSDLAKLLKNRAPLIAAGYNAGPRRPLRWRRRGTPDAHWTVFIENIPITETRLYVKHVLANRAHYDAVFARREGGEEWLSRPVAQTRTASR